MSTTDKYRAEEPRYLCYCGTKKYRKGGGTGTVEKWCRGSIPRCRGSTVVQRNTSPLVLIVSDGWMCFAVAVKEARMY